jgi:hypothetical protein
LIGKEWLYYIIDENGLSYYVENGVVKTGNIPNPINLTPDGWQDIMIQWERNMKYAGTQRNFTGSLGFVGDGAQILRYINFNNNFEVKIYLLIQKKRLEITNDEYAFVYRFFYKGDLDFSSYSQSDINEGFKVTMNIMDGGFNKYLKAYNNVTYEVPCNKDTPGAVPVWMDGIEFYNKFNFILPDFYNNVDFQFAMPLTFVNQEGDSFGIYTASQQMERINIGDEATYCADSDNEFFLSIKPVTVRVTATIVYTNQDDYPIYFTHVIRTSLGNVYTLHKDSDTSPLMISAGQTVTRNIDLSIPLAVNEKAFVILWHQIDPIFPGKLSAVSNDFSVEVNSTIDPTLCYCLRPNDLFKSLVDNMTTNQYEIYSQLLTDRSHIVHTCGNAIRGFDDAVIKTSFDDFFTTRSVIDAAGLNVNEDLKTVLIETRKSYFDTSNPIDLGLIKNLKISVAKDFIFNLLKVGYPEQTYDSVNGKNEFNNTSQFTDIITRIAKELDLLSESRADGYGIETLRMDYFNRDSVDSSSDNDNFVINIEDEPREDGYYHLRRASYVSITGVISPNTIFNIEDLTPKRLLLTNGDFIHSCLYNFGGTDLTFQTTEKNALLSTDNFGVTITENANVPIDSLAPAYFIPVQFDFETKVPFDLVELLTNDPNRCFKFTYNGIVYTGFNMKVGIAPNDNKSQSFTLLSTVDNDLKKLIYG